MAEPTKKQNLIKIIIGIVVAAAAGGGADAAGVDMPNPEELERLGVVGALILVTYLHLVWWPVVQAHTGLTRKIAVKLGVVVADAAPVTAGDTDDPVVAEQPAAVEPPKKRASTHPQLVAVKPLKEPR